MFFDIHEYAEYSMAATTLAGQSDVGICPSARGQVHKLTMIRSSICNALCEVVFALLWEKLSYSLAVHLNLTYIKAKCTR